ARPSLSGCTPASRPPSPWPGPKGRAAMSSYGDWAAPSQPLALRDQLMTPQPAVEAVVGVLARLGEGEEDVVAGGPRGEDGGPPPRTNPPAGALVWRGG